MPRGTVRSAAWLFVLLLAAPAFSGAQEATRAGQIEDEREKKKAAAKPEENSKGERILNTVKEKKMIERLATGYHGLTLVLGGLATGQGFAIGPQFRRDHLARDQMSFRASARYAFSQAYLMDAEIAFPRLAGEQLRLEFFGQHRNYPRLGHYGPGPSSLKSDRTHYRLEDAVAEGRFIWKPLRPLSLGVSGGGLWVNTGPGNFTEKFARTEDRFTPAQLPGLDAQTSFIRSSAFVQFDYRDNPGGPRRGGNYIARFTYFDDTRLQRHDFRQVHLEVQQYIPFFNERRVIAFRGRTLMSLTNGAASTVPFYLQPSLGGSDDLRGYRAYRFHDNHQILLNLEYQWETFSGLNLAIFADAGKVVPRRSQVNFHNLESSVGFGFRFNVRNNTFIRIDTGFSQEGFQIWFKFNNAF